MFYKIIIFFAVIGLVSCSVADKPEKVSVEESNGYVSNYDFYVVKKGDTLYSLASYMGCSYQDMALLNGIEPPYKILVGQKIKLECYFE